MQRERWERLERLFARGLALPEARRAGWLSRACGDDEELRCEVEELLRNAALRGMLDTPPLPMGDAEAAIAPSLITGTRLGTWRIERLIGRGGMGEVYAAVRAEAEFTQRGALKLLRFDAIGELARFHAERQILAHLDHPGIAHLLDGGIAPDGRPYTVMEYVNGVSLLEYCNMRGASLRERLDLFAQVCDAVAYAHRNLVIHRDLKPANTLVDAEGNVKLLDFGIAKLVDTAASNNADATATVAPFTPDYAAPEQLSGEPVTTATDVYALGVLLFELLTGDRPLRRSGLPSTQALVLLDRESPPASRVARDKTSAPVPASALAGDIDAILAKCLRREGAHRYDTVNALKLDLRRHLAHEPVLAREGARLYVLGRVLRRYRWAVTAATALIFTLAAGLAGTLWEAQRAETQARTANAVQEFVADLFRANSSNQRDPVKARATTARELLDLGAKKIDAAMDDAPAAKLSVLNLLSELYQDLRLNKQEIRLRREAVELTRGLYGANAPELAAALVALAGAMHGTDVESQREPLLREARTILDRNGDDESEIRGRLLLRLHELYNASPDTMAKALDYARQSVRVLEKHPPSVDLAEAWYSQGLAETYSHMPAQALTSLNRAIAISGAVQGVPNPKLIVMYYQLADTQNDLQEYAQAERSARTALKMALQINGENHVDAVRTRMMLGRVLLASGRSREGLEQLARAKRDVLRLLGPNDPFHTRDVLEANGAWQSEVGDIAEGLDDLNAAASIRRRTEGATLNLTSSLRTIARDLIELGRFEEAAGTIREVASIYEANGWTHGTPRYNGVTLLRLQLARSEGRMEAAHEQLANLVFENPNRISSLRISTRLVQAEIAMRTGDAATQTESLAKARADISSGGLVKDRQLYLSSADLIEGESRLKARDAEAAAPFLQRALAVREKLFVAPHPRLAEAQVLLATCYLELGRRNEAQALATTATVIDAHYPRLSNYYLRPLRELQARLLAPAKQASRHAMRRPG